MRLLKQMSSSELTWMLTHERTHGTVIHALPVVLVADTPSQFRVREYIVVYDEPETERP